LRGAFHHFFRPTETEMKNMLASALICYDANVFLNVYRYSDETRAGLIEVFKTFADRTLLPHQFALEYSKNRAKTIVDQVNLCAAAETAFEKVIKDYITPKDKQPFLSEKSKNAFTEIISEISEKRGNLEAMISDDSYADLLFSLFDDKVGKSFDEDALNQLHKVAEERYEKKIPPGFSDLKDKGAPNAYGDFIAWKQLIEISKERKSDFIFVTDDSKEDWRLQISGKTIGPRPELLEEFFKETGQRLWIFTSESFLIATKESGATEVKDSVIEEVGSALTAQASPPLSESKMSSQTKVKSSNAALDEYQSNTSDNFDKISRSYVDYSKKQGTNSENDCD
jgi:hypothetical protein